MCYNKPINVLETILTRTKFTNKHVGLICHCSVVHIGLVIDFWNHLPLEIVSATSIALFKKKLEAVSC